MHSDQLNELNETARTRKNGAIEGILSLFIFDNTEAFVSY